MFELLDGILGLSFIVQAAFSIGVSYAAIWIASQFAGRPDTIKMPKVGGFPLQSAMKGGGVPKIYGRKRVPGNVIWCGPPVPYEYGTEQEVEGGKGAPDQTYYTAQTKYRRSFLIAFCEGPGVFISLWKGKNKLKNLNPTQEVSEYHDWGIAEGIKTLTSEPLTVFEGNSNTGISDLTGEDYGEWPNLCCIFFEDYDLGGTEALPNFSAEIECGTDLQGKTLIYDLAGLQAMNDDLSADYVLMTDLDASDTANWNGGEGFVPIGSGGDEFVGTFDGRNHTITGLYVNDPSFPGKHGGLFGHVGKNTPETAGHVSNVRGINFTSIPRGEAGLLVGIAAGGSTFTDIFVSGTMTNGIGHNSGGFVGRSYNGCTYTRCGVTGSLTLTSNYNSYGGFVGFIDGAGNVYTDCYSRFTIARDAGDCNTGPYTGGFCGREDQNDNTFTRCYAAASIQYQNSCYNYAYNTRPNVFIGGGFMGSADAGNTFSSCYWDTEEGASVYPDAAKFASGYKNERQNHDISANPTGGHFHISHDGNTTGEIAWNANEATVQSACDAAFGAGEVDIEFDSSDKWDTGNMLKVMFYGSTYGQSPQADLTFDMTALLPAATTVNSSDDVTGVAPLSDANITGKTTAQMQTQSTFDGWDFSDDGVWYMGSSGYPELRVHRLSGSDMNAWDIIKDVIENDRYGAGRTDIFNSSNTVARDYWTAQNMLISIVIDDVKPWQDWVDYILSHVGGYRFSSGGLLNLGVLRDEAAAFALTDDDLLQPNPDADILPPKVNIKKRPVSDTFNRLEVNWSERDNKYYNAVAVAYDCVDQARTGSIRKSVVALTAIHNGEQAKKMAYRFLIDGLYRFSFYQFKVSYKYMLLEVGDVGTLSDGHTLSSQKIRIMGIEEDSNGRGLDITAMDDYAALYPDIAYQTDGSGWVEPADITLGDVTVNFREDVNLNSIYLSCAPASASCNGGFVYRSYDDVSYGLVGRFTISGVTGGDANAVGTTSGFIPEHPAVTWAQNESILVNIGIVTDLRTDITDTEFWNDHALAKIGDEIIAFKTASETATAGVWQISNLRRGLFGTEPVAHYSGETFCTLMPDSTYKFDPTNIGRTLYFKVITYYGNEYQSLADVSSFSVTIQGYLARPAAASLLRLTSDENDGGSGSYSGATFTLYWNLGSRVSGFNYGDWLNLPWNNYIADPELQDIWLRFEQTDGTLIAERSIAVANSATITKATDLGGYDNAVIKVIPRRSRRSRLENSILVESV